MIKRPDNQYSYELFYIDERKLLRTYVMTKSELKQSRFLETLLIVILHA